MSLLLPDERFLPHVYPIESWSHRSNPNPRKGLDERVGTTEVGCTGFHREPRSGADVHNCVESLVTVTDRILRETTPFKRSRKRRVEEP